MDQQPKHGILFDLDGCLIHSLPIWRDAAISAIRAANLSVSPEALLHIVIPNLKEIEQFGHPDPQAFILEVLASVNGAIDSIIFHEGVSHTLDHLKDEGIVQAIVTSSSRPWVERILRNNGKENHFESIVVREDVSRTKPFPDSLLHALTCLQLTADEVVMVGDNPVDIAVGKAAQMQTIWFYPPANDSFYIYRDVKALNPDFIIRDFNELPYIISGYIRT